MFRVLALGAFVLALAILAVEPNSVAAKCPDAPSDLVCTHLKYSLLPEKPVAGKELTVIVHWVDDRTGKIVANAEWLAKRGKPAYLWLWDHEPSDLERSAFVTGFENQGKLPQLLVTLLWDGEKYRGTFTFPEAGRWYLQIGTVVPAAMEPTLESDGDYVGQMHDFDVPTVSPRSLTRELQRSSWLWIGGSVIVVALLASTAILLKITFKSRLNVRRFEQHFLRDPAQPDG